MVNLCISFFIWSTLIFGGLKNEGVASYYHDSLHGNLTANGEIYNERELSVAHKDLEFGTILLVTNINNNESVVVVVNDRGPFISGRDLDLSRRAAEEIGMLVEGVVEVEYIIIGIDD